MTQDDEIDRSHPPAGEIECGLRPAGQAGTHRWGEFLWARRLVNWRSPVGLQRTMLNVSRSTLSPHARVSIALFLGDEKAVSLPGAQVSEDELRDLLYAAGCTWARPERELEGGNHE